MIRQNALQGLRAVAGIAAVLCVCATAASAQDNATSPGTFFNLDLARAVLSPKPLGPLTHFAPLASATKAAREPKLAALTRKPKIATIATTQVGRHRYTVRVAKRARNPLNAQAFDTRRNTGIQRWPCRDGGICEWRNVPYQ